MPREFGKKRDSPPAGDSQPHFKLEEDQHPVSISISGKQYQVSRFKWSNDNEQSGETVRIVKVYTTRNGNTGMDKRPGISIDVKASEDEVKELLDAIYDKLFSPEDEH